MVSWWPFDGTGNDLEKGNTAQLVGSASFTTGMVSTALQLNGVDAHAVASASSSLNVGLGEGFTIDAWLKADNLAVAQPIVEFNNGTVGGVHL